MAERELINAFADCIERIEEGESLESCLQDYPQHADYLRQMLQTTELVHRAHYDEADVNEAQERGRKHEEPAYAHPGFWHVHEIGT